MTKIFKTKRLFVVTMAYLSLFTINNLFAQEQNFFCRRYTTEEGLTSNTIVEVQQDKITGSLWIATTNGLNQFDGNTFRRFKHIHNDSTSINSNVINTFLIVGDKLWVGYQDGIIQQLDLNGNVTETIGKNAGLPSASITSLWVDSENLLWVGFHGYGLLAFDTKKQRLVIRPPELPSDEAPANHINKIYEQGELLWLAASDGLYSFHKKTQRLQSHPYYTTAPTKRDDSFTDILPEGSKGLWLTAWSGGLSFYNFKTSEFNNYKFSKSSSPLKDIGDVLYDYVAGTMLVGTADEGLLFFDKTKKVFQKIDVFSPIREAPQIVTEIFKDEDGHFWIGSAAGLYQIFAPPYQFTFTPMHFSKADLFQGNALVNSIYESKKFKKTFFAIQFGDGLNMVDHNLSRQKHFAIPVKNPPNVMEVRDLLAQGEDSLWVVSRDLLLLFNMKTEKWMSFNDVPSKLGGNKYVQIIKRNSNELLVAKRLQGIYKFDLRKGVLTPLASEAFAGKSISSIAADSSGNIFAGTQNHGLVVIDRFNHHRLFVKESISNSIKSNSIQRVYVDKHQNLWVTYPDNGASIISRESITRGNPIIQNFADIAIMNEPSGDVIESGNEILIATSKGIVKYKHENNQGKLMGAWAGLKDLDNFLTYRFSKVGNSICLGTMGGYYTFYPNLQPEKEIDRPLFIKSLLVNGKVQPINNPVSAHKIELNYKENDISIEFSQTDFKSFEDRIIYYNLTNIDHGWVKDQGRRNVTYSNLLPGNYTFSLSTSGNDSKASARIEFQIIPPFWMQQWFFVLACIIIVGIAFALVHLRIRSIKRREAIQSSFKRKIVESQLTALQSQMNPHFIFNSLNSINRFIIKESAHKASDYLSKFARLIRLILENSVERTITLEKEIKTLQLYLDLECLRFENKFDFHIDVDERLDLLIKIPSMIIQPFIENAIWHGILHNERPGKIEIKIYLSRNGIIVCQVKDNGIGRKKASELNSRSATKKKSFGIELSLERLKILNHEIPESELINVIDLQDIHGNAEGTLVEIKLIRLRNYQPSSRSGTERVSSANS